MNLVSEPTSVAQQQATSWRQNTSDGALLARQAARRATQRSGEGDKIGTADSSASNRQIDRVGQVVLIQLYVADGSSWPSPGFGQSGGADTLRTSCTMIRSGSQIGNGYSGTFLLNPTTVGLNPE